MRGRIRSIKPDLFADEKLWDLDAHNPGLHVLRTFEGLWCFADREGRFEWRPRALKSHILPYWDGDMERVLDLLQSGGFITRYACGTREYGVVVNFTRHQTPNNKEVASQIPAPPTEFTRAERVPVASGVTEIPASLQKESSGNGILGTGSWERERERRAGRANGLSLPEGPNGPFGQSPEPRAQSARFGAEEMRATFTHVYRAVHRDVPKLDGKGTSEFPERVHAAARDRGVDPRELFESRLQRWLSAGLKPIERVAPYACFAASWPTLEDAPQTRKQRIDELTRKSAEALGRQDLDTYEKLNREVAELMGVEHAAK